MKQKIIVVMLALLFAMALASAEGVSDLTTLSFPSTFEAGQTNQLNFSFKYLQDTGNLNNSFLVLKVNITSLDPDFPVWEDDFSLSGRIIRYSLFGNYEKNVSLECVENSSIEFIQENETKYSEGNMSNGTFFCYDPENYFTFLELDKKDEISLDIGSDIKLSPGNYSISVSLISLKPESYPQSSGGGGGSGVGKLELKEGENNIQRDMEYFFWEEGKYSVLRLVSSQNGDSAVFKISNLKFNLLLNQTWAMDVDGDGENDISIKLISISRGKPKIYFDRLENEVIVNSSLQKASSSESGQGDSSDFKENVFAVSQSSGNYRRNIAGGVLVIAGVSGTLIFIRRRRIKKLKK